VSSVLVRLYALTKGPQSDLGTPFDQGPPSGVYGEPFLRLWFWHQFDFEL